VAPAVNRRFDGRRVVSAIASGSIVVLAAVILVLADSSSGPQPPGAGRAFATAALLGAPGAIGLVGAWTGRRTILAAAGILCLLQSVISFSGVTLVYLLPAIVLVRSATGGRPPSERQPIRPSRLVLAAILAIPIVIVVVRLGFLGILGLGLAAAFAAGRGRGQGLPAPSVGDVARGAAVVLLVVGGWAASFALAETACWIGHAGPDGAIVWESIPQTDTLTLGPNDVAATCAGGTLTTEGTWLTAGLLVAALAVAALPNSGRRVSDPSIRSLPEPP
jgi:hypothetical protein